MPAFTSAASRLDQARTPTQTRVDHRQTEINHVRQGPGRRPGPNRVPDTPRGTVNDAPTATELLKTPGALLTRSHLRELGLGRAAIDAVFRQLPVVVFPGSSRPHLRREDYLALVDSSTYDERRVRFSGR